MFGYELADILLFDLETLIESYAGYLGDFKWFFYLGLVTNLFLIYFINKSLRVVYTLLSLAWIFPGYFFFIKQFEPIFWPSEYFGYWAIAMGLLQIIYALRRSSSQQYSQRVQFTHPPAQNLPLGRIQFAFAMVTVLPVLISWHFSPHTIVAFGTSAMVAALGTLSLYLPQKNWLARTICALSLLWCLTIVVVIWALIYKV